MTKRQQLDYDSEALVEHLKASTGQGINALFSDTSPSERPSEDTLNQAQFSSAGQPNDRAYDRTGDHADERPEGNTTADMWTIPSIPRKRRPERYAFQFWADQIVRLKKLNQLLNLLTDPDDQASPTLSDLVRVALDDYLEARIKQLQPSLPEQHGTANRLSEHAAARPYARSDARTAVLSTDLSAP